MNNSPSQALNLIRYAVLGLIAMLNGLVITGVIESGEQNQTLVTHAIFAAILVTLYLGTRRVASLTQAPQATILLCAIFEFGALLGFGSIFIFSSPLYLFAGSLFAATGIMALIPQMTQERP